MASLFSPITGTVVPLTEVPDEAFSSGMLGQGFAVEPSRDCDGTVFAPADGMMETVADARHAYTMRTDDGLELLIHIGVDTVSLGGQPFTALVSAGERIKAGQPIARADFASIRAAHLPAVTPVIVTNSDAVRSLTPVFGQADGGSTIAAQYSR